MCKTGLNAAGGQLVARFSINTQYVLLISLLAIGVTMSAHASERLYSCFVMRLDKGETLHGPVSSVVLPDRKVTFELRDGMTLTGPMVIQLCDGHLEILKP